MTCRKNVKNMTNDEKRWFVEALYAVRSRNSVLHPGSQSRYDDFVELHRDAMSTSPDPAHGDSAFFPWHRELLWQFEKELQITHPQVRIPYWDWTREQASGDPGYPFTYDFLGPNGDSGDDDRVKREPGAPSPYPHPFDPNNWDITVKDGGEPDYLQRSFGTHGTAPNLPENTTSVTGTSWSFHDAIANVGYLTHRSRSESIHNLVHRWCNGNMLTASSPNDPVFFLHHAAIDRMWSIWQDKNSPSLADRYINTSGAAGHVENQPMVFGSGTPPWPGSMTPANVINGHIMHGGDGVWYDTDLPEITLESGPALAFDDIPSGLTAYRAVNFRVQTCRQVHFRITGIPSAPFGTTALGTNFMVDTNYDPEAMNAYVWVQFDASLGSTMPGMVQIEAYIIDHEGYYAPNVGDEYILDSWNITLTGSIVPRVGVSLAMVLDRSWSMNASAGGGSTRSQLMKSAVSIFHALLDPSDEIGLVGFDHETVSALPFGPASAGLGTALAPGGNLDPRGNTGIGLGIQDGAAMLLGGTHARKALLVLTDGNENVHPYINELPAGTISTTTYAIGFGLPGHVSDAVLNQITQNSGGDLIITGNLNATAEMFLLTKYFLQILAGIQSQNVVLDPDGALTWGAEQVVDIPLTQADTYVDIIVLCPMSAWLNFKLITPEGKVIDETTAVSMPNANHILHPEMQTWRLALPALPSDAGTAHEGTWKAVLSLRKPEKHDHRLTHLNETHFSSLVRGAVPWSCVVHATSNIHFDASLVQKSLEPGATIELYAQLTEYLVPFLGSADVWAEIYGPKGISTTLKLDHKGQGRYKATFTAEQAGPYRFRTRAEGYGQSGGRFTREKTLTASIFVGGDTPQTESVHDTICRLLECLFEKGALNRKTTMRLKKLGVDVDAIRQCLAICQHKPDEVKISITEKRDEIRLSAANLTRLIAVEPKAQKAHERNKYQKAKKAHAKAVADTLPEHLFANPDEVNTANKKGKGKPSK